ncbi:aspartyl-phosphate phosphatase Spo0E family protein [Paenibacillus sediminis]|uniref:aspartyl-phosphate phosphatase Spo0E family protein n=1 Tax=Paenibacillus sediminis TaxID=664909 RepID=UPI0031589778
MAERTNKWLTKAKDRARVVSLEDEIQLLRQKMEITFLQEKSFTSDIVIEISSLLDLKINEYMKYSGKKRI